MGILDVSQWDIDHSINISGTRVKHWIKEPKSEQLYMFKVPKENTGETWAEKVSSEIGKLLGFDMMDVHIAVRNNICGTIAKNFIADREEFYEGGDLIGAIIDFNRYKLNNYTFEIIIKALEEFHLEREFIIIPIFDALIGNQDRHCDNWGIITNGDNYRIAPIYDNGASLGFHLSEERLKLMFRDKNMFKAYTRRSHSLIGVSGKRKPKYTELLPIIREMFPKEYSCITERLTILNQNNILQILNSIPESIMGAVYKDWVLKLILFRKDWILNLNGGSDNS